MPSYSETYLCLIPNRTNPQRHLLSLTSVLAPEFTADTDDKQISSMPGIEPSDSELEMAMWALIIGAESEDKILIGYVPPKGSLCANTIMSFDGSGGVKVNCGNEASLSCGRCHLVRVSHYSRAVTC